MMLMYTGAGERAREGGRERVQAACLLIPKGSGISEYLPDEQIMSHIHKFPNSTWASRFGI